MRSAGCSRHTSRSRSSMAQSEPARASATTGPDSASSELAATAGPRAPPRRPLLAEVNTDEGRAAGVDVVTSGLVLLVEGILDRQAGRPHGRERPAGAQVDQPEAADAILVLGIIVAIPLNDPGAAQRPLAQLAIHVETCALAGPALDTIARIGSATSFRIDPGHGRLQGPVLEFDTCREFDTSITGLVDIHGGPAERVGGVGRPGDEIVDIALVNGQIPEAAAILASGTQLEGTGSLAIDVRIALAAPLVPVVEIIERRRAEGSAVAGAERMMSVELEPQCDAPGQFPTKGFVVIVTQTRLDREGVEVEQRLGIHGDIVAAFLDEIVGRLDGIMHVLGAYHQLMGAEIQGIVPASRPAARIEKAGAGGVARILLIAGFTQCETATPGVGERDFAIDAGDLLDKVRIGRRPEAIELRVATGTQCQHTYFHFIFESMGNTRQR